ncbi:branched-chain amino acid aminotransferase [Parelusimicrobium proximum]|uniref:branched-chain amino acid aminotransferase n=1 Tax=Parelusimicrobium proximum TaxID=3228953 RepID=UPI003D183CED
MPEIEIIRTNKPGEPIKDISQLGFGKYFTDHMFVMDYTEGKGWHNAKIMPFQNIELSPAAMILHYGQEVFEGMKAYKAKDGRVMLFRPQENFKRLNMSNDRIAIPKIDEDFALEALKKLVSIDQNWIPQGEGASLYIRPYIFATQPNLGVKISDSYKFMIIMSPVGPYFAEGLAPTKILVESEYVRAVKGGTGEAKTGGNYASAMLAQGIAAKEGYKQVLWLDGVEHKYIEEVGAMNVFFVINDEIITPALNGSILHGITRKSVIDLLNANGYKVNERRISVEEVFEAADKGTLQEMFGSGTAAVVSPVGKLKWKGNEVIINNNEVGKITSFCYDNLTGIQNGDLPDTMNWMVLI